MHIEIPGWWYFLAARTIDGKGIFSGEKKMKILQDVIAHAQRLYDAKIYGYILWSNHYHMILSFDSEDLAHFVRNIHSYSSQKASIYDATPGRRVWYQYWDRLLRIQYSLGDLYRRVSYIMHNPIKHEWCDSFDEAITYPWSSIPGWVRVYGKDGLWECWLKYPVTDWSEE
ncbi:MAG: hypothetical protein COV60_01890 [Candidatus Magasanikbacteria bacterium CG11_big_fil_rev_8_21_14_0_20_43_7]|uniref:Transposase IS200-like domain-containing protein n=1 Tax=Candidatus Magasanikbacteria bacterium CG11_big_fil_rev_8_21_14_0_20_43_7 TaxID=1974654 RepID=A0A2H0N2L1_9BACT|nr:MAG: hypothetical protein COV60_01890 [Candidatus Magasanikbacteria bacterium CG11_big_fil_rev_8_21_14_0_20_43_7]